MASRLPITEELDFVYLLELMPPLHDVPEFSWLPELFSIIGHERLLLLCKYTGGETITIPTIEQLTKSIDALQLFYDINIKQCKTNMDIPIDLRDIYMKLVDIYNVGNN